jgi:hypothetical protein
MRTALAGVFLAWLLVISAASGATTPTLNVKGSLVRSSGGGGCYPGEACDPRPPAAFVVFSRNGHATRARLAPGGAFALHLAAGVYAVSTAPAHGITPSTVRVPRVGTVHPRLIERSS